MIIQCSQCSTQFRLDDSLLLPNGRQVACSKCSHQWFVEPPQTEQPQTTPQTPEPTDPPSQPAPETAEPKPEPTPPTPDAEPPHVEPNTSVPPKRNDDDLSPLDKDTSKPDFSMGDDISERLARIRESVQPKNAPQTETPQTTPPTSETNAPEPVDPEPAEPTPPKIGEPDTPAGAYQTVDDYGINDGAVFEKTPENKTEQTTETNTNPSSEEPVIKDIQNFESALSKASQLAEMAELKDNSTLPSSPSHIHRDATTGEPISSPLENDPLKTDDPSETDPNDSKKTAKAQNAIMEAVRKKKDGFKAKKEERPSHIQRSERSWLTQIIILLCVIVGLGLIGLLVAKDRIMDMFPETRPYYALMGAKINSVGKGLVILEPTASISEKGDTRKLVISGIVENRLDTTEPLPLLLAQVKDMNGDVLVQWTFKGKTDKIPPKGKVTYSTSIAEPSEKANSVAVTIANMNKKDTPKATSTTSQGGTKKIGNAPKVTPVKKDTNKTQ